MDMLPEHIETALPGWLRSLIECRTENPPGNEREAAQFIRGIFESRGMECDVHEGKPGRSNIVAYLGDETELPPLVLLSHIDVVEAGDADTWTHAPFSGITEKGVIWGRGAIDAKGVTVMHLGAFLSAADRMREEGWVPNRQIVFVASADEEQGSLWGAEYLTGEIESLRRPALVLTEGGGFAVDLEGEPFMMVTLGEKGRIRLKVTARGDAGHASCPPGSQAVTGLASWISNLLEYTWPEPSYATLRRFRETVGEFGGSDTGGTIGLFRKYLETPGIYLDRVYAGKALNAVPAEAVCECEIGMLPPWDEEFMRNRLEEITAGTGAEVEVISCLEGFEYGDDASLLRNMEDAVRRYHEGYSGLLPVLALGRTDGRFFASHGSVSIGCSPLLPHMPFSDVLEVVHRRNERIPLASLSFGATVLTDVLFSVCGYDKGVC